MKSKQTTFNRNPIIWLKDAWFLAKPYWQSEEKFSAIALIGVIIMFNLFMVAMTVILNKWYNVFYDALQHLDKAGFFRCIIKFCIIAFFYILFAVLAYYFRKILEIRWRRWLTQYYVNSWLSHKAYYKARFLSQISDNPDQRISEDINAFISLTLDLTLGLINSIVTLASFVIILWTLSGNLSFKVNGHPLIIHGYMVWAALLYAIIGTYITFKIGKPLIKLNYQQQAYEANFRFSLMRIREYSENIAFYNGESREKSDLNNRFNQLVGNFIAIIYRQLKIDIFTIGYNQSAIIFPLVVAAPRYFAKTIQLGDLMQISSAFGKVQDALSYFISVYTSLSGWRAVMDRLYGFQLTIGKAKDLTSIPILAGTNYLQIKNLTINLPNQKILIPPIYFSLNQGDRLLICGRSGSGKTTLLRTIAGLWHFAKGNIYQKPQLTSLFIAQKAYLPLGQLKLAICYPKTHGLPSNAEIINVLKLCNLNNLSNQLDSKANWSNILSLGEQQRIAFCRILINMPDIIYLDEATSALDEETEAMLYQLLNKKLPNSVIISIGHRSTIKQWHNQELNFNQFNEKQINCPVPLKLTHS